MSEDSPLRRRLTAASAMARARRRSLAARGAEVVDTDQIAHRLTAPGGAAMEAIREAFGAGVVAADGALNRPAMRALAFEDPGRPQAPRGHPAPDDPRRERAPVPAPPRAPYVMLAVPC